MKITDELINKFFQGACNQEEAAQVAAFLEQHEELSGQYLGEEEWNQLTSVNHPSLPETQRDRMFIKIRTTINKQHFISNLRQRWPIAASIFFALFIGLFFYSNYRSANLKMHNTATLQFSAQEVHNQSQYIMLLSLKDGSEVQLYPQARISFAKNAFVHERNITLTGKAFFKVAKDKKRPFTVTSGSLSTTALGTAFMVDASAIKSDIRVQLFEGRVVVKSTDNLHDPVFMKPDQELIYVKQSGYTSLKSMKINSLALINPKLFTPAYKTKKNPDISFEHEPIEKVLMEVQQAYQVNLIFPKTGLKNYYFSGSFNLEEDSLARVLHIISETNNLNIIKIKSGYRITKGTD